jgi:peptidoglycan/LPS O-acetylase OafA/YrhL
MPLDFDSSWPIFAMAGIYWGFFELLQRSGLVRPSLADAGKLQELESLRGICALGVFFHHSSCIFHYLTGQGWNSPGRLYGMLGCGPVTLFFMITGFLFWNKLPSIRGPQAWRDYFRRRALRLAPAYWVSLVGVVVGSFWIAGWSLPLPAGEYSFALGHWFFFGFPDGAFPSLGQGFQSVLFNARVAWSLRVEWIFYVSLPGRRAHNSIVGLDCRC